MRTFNAEESAVIEKLYGQGLNDYQVAKEIRVGREALRHWRSGRGIPSKTRKKGLSGVACEEALCRISKGETLQSIGKDYGVARSSIRRLLLRYGHTVPLRHQQHPDWASSYVLTSRQRSVLLGDMFGDGCLVETSEGSAYYQCSHCTGQEAFVVWKFGELRPLSSRIHRGDMANYHNPTGSRFGYVSMKTWTNRDLQDMRHLFYPSGEGDKILPTSVVDQMDALSLAVWYMGDGSLSRKTGYMTLGKGQDGRSLEASLNAKFGPMFDFRDYGTQWSAFVDPDLFFPGVTPHILPCMAYKVPERYRHLAGQLVSFGSVYGNGDFSFEVFNAMDEQQKEALVDDATNYYMTSGFPYPEATPARMVQEFENLCGIQKPVDPLSGIVPSLSVGTTICNALFPHRYQAERCNRRVLDIFTDRSRLRSFMVNRFKHFSGLFTDATIRTGVGLLGVPNNFNPTAAKALYEAFLPKGGTTLDFCAGYGGRLLGFLSTQVGSLYVGVEPLSKSYVALDRLASLFDTEKTVRLHHTPFEDFDAGEGVFDLAFSSPPYYTLEIYGDEPTQSVIRYPSYPEWLDRFWFVTLTKTLRALKPGGHLVFSLGGCGSQDIVGDTIKYMETMPIDRCPELRMSSWRVLLKEPKNERILVYRKPPV